MKYVVFQGGNIWLPQCDFLSVSETKFTFIQMKASVLHLEGRLYTTAIRIGNALASITAEILAELFS